MLQILDLFSVDRPIWSADEIILRCGHSRPTGYRYVKELCTAGLLRRTEGGYTLGARIIEMDYYIRQCDPLLSACKPVMSRVALDTGCNVLLASMYGSRILAIHHELGNDLSSIAFGRGRPMPLFRGGGSKVIIASLSLSEHKKLYAKHSKEIAEAGLGNTLVDFRKRMLEIRREGHVVSLGELDPDAAGIAVPIPAGDSSDPAALVLVTTKTRFNLIERSLLIDIGKNAAQQIESTTRGKRNAELLRPVGTGVLENKTKQPRLRRGRSQ